MLLERYAPGLGLAAFFAVVVLANATLFALLKYSLASRRPKGLSQRTSNTPSAGKPASATKHQIFYEVWREWQKEYGDMIGLKFGTTNVVISNNYKAVRDLFDKRGAIYASRPPNYVGNEIMCPGSTHILLVPYGEGWWRLRKTVQQLLGFTAVDIMLPIQSAEGIQTLHDIMVDPDNYFDHIRRYSSAVIMASVFGQRGESFKSTRIETFYEVQDKFTAMISPGATPPVDEYPILLAPWKRKARTVRKEQRAVYSQLLEDTKAKLSQGLATDCFMAKLLRDQEKSGLDDEQVIYVGGILLEAGSDTTVATLLSFCLAVIAHPDVLRKCQEEVDTISVDRTQTSPTSTISPT